MKKIEKKVENKLKQIEFSEMEQQELLNILNNHLKDTGLQRGIDYVNNVIFFVKKIK